VNREKGTMLSSVFFFKFGHSWLWRITVRRHASWICNKKVENTNSVYDIKCTLFARNSISRCSFNFLNCTSFLTDWFVKYNWTNLELVSFNEILLAKMRVNSFQHINSRKRNLPGSWGGRRSWTSAGWRNEQYTRDIAEMIELKIGAQLLLQERLHYLALLLGLKSIHSKNTILVTISQTSKD
jgi:hypothetical protein